MEQHGYEEEEECMNYFDGVKVGDTVYLWDKPCVVEMCDKAGNLSVESYGWFTKNGMWYGKTSLGQVLFWQPVTPPVPPPRPKKMVQKMMKGERMVWKIFGTLKYPVKYPDGGGIDYTKIPLDTPMTMTLEWEEDEP